MKRVLTFKNCQTFFSEAEQYLEQKNYSENFLWGGDGDFSGTAPPIYGITQSAFPQPKIRLRPKFWYRKRNTKREDNTNCSKVVFYQKSQKKQSWYKE